MVLIGVTSGLQPYGGSPMGWGNPSVIGLVAGGLVLGPVLGQLPPADAARLTGHTFLPLLISDPFQHGLVLVLTFSIAASLVAGAASALRGGKYVHQETDVIPLAKGAKS
jgi:hypothetical protein